MPWMKPGYDWKRTLWKGLRPALVAAVLGAAVAFVQSITPEALVDLGIPTVIAIAIIEAARNWVKQIDR